MNMNPLEHVFPSYTPVELQANICSGIAKDSGILMCISKSFANQVEKLCEHIITPQLSELEEFCNLKLDNKELSGLAFHLAQKILALCLRASFTKKIKIYAQLFSLSVLCNDAFANLFEQNRPYPQILQDMKCKQMQVFTPQLILREFRKIHLVFDGSLEQLKNNLLSQKNQAIFRQNQTSSNAITFEIYYQNQNRKDLNGKVKIGEKELEQQKITTFSKIYEEAFQKTNAYLFDVTILPISQRVPMIMTL